MTHGPGKDADFSAYVAARQAALLRRAYLLCGDEHVAEDLVQTALAKLYLAWGRVREREQLDAYTRRIMVNELNSWWRRPWRRREHPTDELPSGAGACDTYDEGDRAALWALLATLTARQRTVLVLRYYEDLDVREVAATLGVSEGTVKSTAHRALELLRRRASHLEPLTRTQEAT